MDHATALILRTLNVKGLVTSSDTYFIRKQILEYLDDHIERSGFVKFQSSSQLFSLGLLNEISLITLRCSHHRCIHI